MGGLGVENGASPDDHLWMKLDKVRYQIDRSSNRQGNFHDGYARVCDRFSGEMCIVSLRDTNGGNNPDLLNLRANFLSFHRRTLL